MIIHGGYAKRIREGDSVGFNDIDLFCTHEALVQFCSMLSNSDYIVGRPESLLPSRAVIILVSRKRADAVIKFDAEIVNEDLYQAALNLSDTQKHKFFGMTVGVVSAASDMLIKEVCDFGNPKHAEDAQNYRNTIGNIDLNEHENFRQLWVHHISQKYKNLAKLGIYDPVSKKLRMA